MRHHIKLKIPVKTYIRKYLEHHYPGPQRLTYTNELGKLLYVLLEKQGSSLFSRPSVNFLEKRYRLITDHFIVLLPSNNDVFYRTGFEIPPVNLAIINNFFEEMLIKELHIRASIYEKVGISNNQAIEHLCEDYNIIIDVDITHAAFKKALYRYRKSRKEVKAVERLEIVSEPKKIKSEILKANNCFPCNEASIFNMKSFFPSNERLMCAIKTPTL